MSACTTGVSPSSAQAVPHLAERDGVRVRPLQVADRGALHAQQAVLDAMEVLADDEQAGLRQQVVDVRHPAGQAVLARQHGQLGARPRAPRPSRVSNDSQGSVVMSG